MGNLLEKIYDLVIRNAGNNGRMKLAVKTGVPRAEAANTEDSNEIVMKFKEAATEILGEDVDDLLEED